MIRKIRFAFASLAMSACTALAWIQPLSAGDTQTCQGSGCCENPSGLTAMHHLQVPKSGIALGGIGAGCAELRQDGIFYQWQIFNNRPLGVADPPPFDNNSMLFFVVRYQEEGREPRLKLLQIEDQEIFGGIENYAPVYIYPWMSGVAKVESRFRFPFANLTFTDPDMPFVVEMEAFSPFIPNDLKHSAMPVIFTDFTIRLTGDRPVDVMLMASFRNAAGYETEDKLYKARLSMEPWGKTATMTCTDMDTTLSSFGEISMASLSPATSHYLGWGHIHPYYEIVLRNTRLPDIDDTDARNGLDRSTGRRRAMYPCWATLAVSGRLAGGDTLRHSFVYAWNFPNRYNEPMTVIEGNYYSNFFSSSDQAAVYAASNHDRLKSRSRAFVNGLYATTAEPFVLDQINSHLNTFITSGWLDRSGHFGILEGIFPKESFPCVATIDVSVYGSIPVLALFPELQKSTMRSYRDMQEENGLILHSLYKNFDRASMGRSEVTDRLDLPAQYVILVLRDYFWTGDLDYLKEMWPSVKKAIGYVLNERDKDGDGHPDMEGIMSSYDNFPMYGTAAYIQSQWLCALSAAAEGADILGDRQAAKKYRDQLVSGKRLFEERLWNGGYYRLYNSPAGEHQGTDEGCLTDQLVGQWLAGLLGLDPVAEPERVRTAQKSILEMSYKPDFGLRNCSWTGDRFWHDVDKDIWVDQANTCWSGVELAFSSFLLYQGLYREAMDVIRTVDDRYRKAGLYFNHQECGGHYYRPMSAWAILNGMLGLSGRGDILSFSPNMPEKDFCVFFAMPGFTAHYVSRLGGKAADIRVLSGECRLRGLNLSGANFSASGLKARIDEKRVKADILQKDGQAVVRFGKEQRLTEGQALSVE
ncbi:hypothetical protein JW906_05730 [bacterium]|nr:hypothetical protein [bacterium]